MITNVAYSAGQRAALSSFFKEAAGISPITMAPPKLRPGVRPAYGAPGVAPAAAAGPSGLTNTHIPTPTPLSADGMPTRASLKPAPRQMSPAAAAAPDVTQVTKNQKPFATGPIPVPAGVDRTQVTQNQKPVATGPIPVPSTPAAPAPAPAPGAPAPAPGAPAPAAPAPAAPAPAVTADKAQPTFMQSIREQAPGALLNTGLMMGIPMAMQAMAGSNNQNQN